MTQIKNPMEIFKLLEKTNCKKCNKPTCLSFAVEVFQGKKTLDQCPYLKKDIIKNYTITPQKQSSIEQDMEKNLNNFKKKITTIDLALCAKRLEAKFSNDRLTLKILGKDFSVDSKGNFYSDIHIHAWVISPILNYIIDGAGLACTGKWVPFRELKNGKTWDGLFQQRCEKPLKQIADTYTDLFKDMIDIFKGEKVENHYVADISLVLHPLPKLPILICFWEPEHELESNLNIFFDSTAEKNLNIESIYGLVTALITMFEKIAQRHG